MARKHVRFTVPIAMLHTHTTRIYADSAYDKYFCLKPSPPLWLAVLFLSREISLPVCMGIAHFAGVDEAALTAMRRLWAFDLSILPAVPAAMLVYLFVRRVPTAPQLVRRLWRRGRVLLALSAILDVAASSANLVRADKLDDFVLVSCIFICIDLLIIGYAVRGERWRDTFADFPTP
jgi:hypothetical protein